LAVITALAVPAPASARALLAHVEVGIGDNAPELFDDPLFTATGIRHVRLHVPFDLVRAGGPQLAEADAWLARARALGLEPLVAFAWSSRRRHYLPTVRQYSARVREFRLRYSWVREYSTWNEANHPGVQPTARNPRRTAVFYRALRRQCHAAGCRVVAVDVLGAGWRRTWPWLRAFRARAGRGPHIWGLHNYPDANRRRNVSTARFLATIPRGQGWITETGGIVRFARRWRRNEYRAARAVRHAFRLTRLSRRIKRIYLYNWRHNPRNRRWDSGLLAANGNPRGGYYELVDLLGRSRYAPPPVVVEPPPKVEPEPLQAAPTAP
jgi:hypothetical protein